MHKSYKVWRDEALKDQDVRKAFEQDDDDPFIEVAHQILKLRKQQKLSQAQLAERVGTTQQAIARIESLDYRGHTLTTLAKVAEALNKRLEVKFVPA